MGEIVGGFSKDDEDWRDDKVPRMCSCALSLKRLAYLEHLKDGTHNGRLRGPKEEPAK
jgi:hypothetical protein